MESKSPTQSFLPTPSTSPVSSPAKSIHSGRTRTKFYPMPQRMIKMLPGVTFRIDAMNGKPTVLNRDLQVLSSVQSADTDKKKKRKITRTKVQNGRRSISSDDYQEPTSVPTSPALSDDLPTIKLEPVQPKRRRGLQKKNSKNSALPPPLITRRRASQELQPPPSSPQIIHSSPTEPTSSLELYPSSNNLTIPPSSPQSLQKRKKSPSPSTSPRPAITTRRSKDSSIFIETPLRSCTSCQTIFQPPNSDTEIQKRRQFEFSKEIDSLCLDCAERLEEFGKKCTACGYIPTRDDLNRDRCMRCCGGTWTRIFSG